MYDLPVNIEEPARKMKRQKINFSNINKILLPCKGKILKPIFLCLGMDESKDSSTFFVRCASHRLRHYGKRRTSETGDQLTSRLRSGNGGIRVKIKRKSCQVDAKLLGFYRMMPFISMYF